MSESQDKELLQTRPMFFSARYQDKFIYTGFVGLPTLNVKHNLWKKQDRFFFVSNLDLQTVQGMGDISENVMPIGVI